MGPVAAGRAEERPLEGSAGVAGRRLRPASDAPATGRGARPGRCSHSPSSPSKDGPPGAGSKRPPLHGGVFPHGAAGALDTEVRRHGSSTGCQFNSRSHAACRTASNRVFMNFSGPRPARRCDKPWRRTLGPGHGPIRVFAARRGGLARFKLGHAARGFGCGEFGPYSARRNSLYAKEKALRRARRET